MLKRKKNLPLDYSLCNQTVTVYRRNGLVREALEGVYFEYTDRREVAGGVVSLDRGCLLIIPGSAAVSPGDLVMPGIGPEVAGWEDLKPVEHPGLCQVTSAQQRYYNGKPCHLEVRG